MGKKDELIEKTIDARDEEIARLKEAWIPVTERLPEKTDAYWVTRLVDGGKSATIYQRGFIADDPESEQWWRRHYTAWTPIYCLEPYRAALKEGEDG